MGSGHTFWLVLVRGGRKRGRRGGGIQDDPRVPGLPCWWHGTAFLRTGEPWKRISSVRQTPSLVVDIQLGNGEEVVECMGLEHSKKSQRLVQNL